METWLNICHSNIAINGKLVNVMLVVFIAIVLQHKIRYYEFKYFHSTPGSSSMLHPLTSVALMEIDIN